MLRIATLAGAMLAATLVQTTAKSAQTIWWHTQGAAVIGYDDPRQCALLFYDAKKAVIFTWEASRVIAQFEDTDWHFQKGSTVDVGIQIGDTWLSGGTGHVIQAAADGQILTTVLASDPTAFLTKADSVTLRLLNDTLVYPINQSKIPALFHGVARCRQFLH